MVLVLPPAVVGLQVQHVREKSPLLGSTGVLGQQRQGAAYLLNALQGPLEELDRHIWPLVEELQVVEHENPKARNNHNVQVVGDPLLRLVLVVGTLLEVREPIPKLRGPIPVDVQVHCWVLQCLVSFPKEKYT